jgi:PTHB1 N-terminus
MSLFKVVQWLDYQCPDQEKNYDSFSLTCARFHVENEGVRESLIVTSHSGYITIILSPTNRDTKEIIEMKLNFPVLSVLCGNFAPQ